MNGEDGRRVEHQSLLSCSLNGVFSYNIQFAAVYQFMLRLQLSFELVWKYIYILNHNSHVDHDLK